MDYPGVLLFTIPSLV